MMTNRRRQRLLLAQHAAANTALEGVSASELDERMMRRAIERARDAAALEEVPIGAVVYRGREIVAEAHNVREMTNDPLGHAEILAIRRASRRLGTWRLNDCSIAVTLEPCPMCAGAIVNARLARIAYGATDPKAGACETLYAIPTDGRLNHTCTVVPGVLADECAALLSSFFRQRRSEKRPERTRVQRV